VDNVWHPTSPGYGDRDIKQYELLITLQFQYMFPKSKSDIILPKSVSMVLSLITLRN
jgi:hypothetical protein